MKRFIAFHGQNNSGIQTKENAIAWARNLLSDTKASKVHICEVIEVAERVLPQIEVNSFFVELDMPVSKAA